MKKERFNIKEMMLQCLLLCIAMPMTAQNKVFADVTSASQVEYVDLGLSVMWATCNLGASSPEEYGNYYAWAETKPRTGSSWNYDFKSAPYRLSGKSYKNVKWSKYTGSDGKTVLDPADDAATVVLGSPWRMPTADEMKELLDKCKWTWTTMNGNKVCKVVGPNGNFIFLPAAGYRLGSSLLYAGTNGNYWSSSLSTAYPYYAYYLGFVLRTHSLIRDWYYDNRCNGKSIRPVRSLTHGQAMKQDERQSSVPTESGASVTNVRYVDLGLSVKWATCNLGASSPEEYGNYYAWAETKPRTGSSWTYDWDATPYYAIVDWREFFIGDSKAQWTKYTGSDDKNVLFQKDDAATVALGSPWRMPTVDEMKELLNKCKWTWTKLNGTSGCKVVGPNGNSIFLPATGCRFASKLAGVGTSGLYWSGSLSTSDPSSANFLRFDSTYHDWDYAGRYYGLSVRPVRP